MDTIQLIRDELKFSQNLTDMFVTNIPDQRMAEQPDVVVNHPAWTIGHITFTLFRWLEAFTGQDNKPSGWSEKFGMGSLPTSNRDDYPTKQELLAKLDEAVNAVDAALASATSKQLDAQLPLESLRTVFPTLGHMAAGLCGAHWSYHLGQLSIWRKAAGLGKAMPK